MRPENVWKWLDAVDQNHLDLLDQWGIPRSCRSPEDTSPQSGSLSDRRVRESYQQYNNDSNTEVASLLQPIPPTGILLRNGSTRGIRQNPNFFACDAKNENHPQSLLPGFPTNFAKQFESENHPQSLEPGLPASFAPELKSENHPQLLRPGFPTNLVWDVETGNRSQSYIPSIATSSEAIRQRTDASYNRPLQISGREGNSESAKPKRLPSFTERASVHGLPEALPSNPIIHVQVEHPVAIKCQGARVVGDYR